MNKRIRKKKGLSKITNEEVWGLDCTLAKFILPRLIKFKQINVNSHPSNLSGMEEWHAIIDKMIWSFEKVIKDDWNMKNAEKEQERYLEGMHLFADYFKDLWD